jgi:hypothetical protein
MAGKVSGDTPKIPVSASPSSTSAATETKGAAPFAPTSAARAESPESPAKMKSGAGAAAAKSEQMQAKADFKSGVEKAEPPATPAKARLPRTEGAFPLGSAPAMMPPPPGLSMMMSSAGASGSTTSSMDVRSVDRSPVLEAPTTRPAGMEPETGGPKPSKPDVFQNSDFAQKFTDMSQKRAGQIGQVVSGWQGNAWAAATRLSALEGKAWKASGLENLTGGNPFGKVQGEGCSDWAQWMYATFDPSQGNALNAKPGDFSIEKIHIDSGVAGLANHDLARVKFRDGETMVLDPWRDPKNPVWKESDYREKFGPMYQGPGSLLSRYLPGSGRVSGGGTYYTEVEPPQKP